MDGERRAVVDGQRCFIATDEDRWIDSEDSA